MNLLRAQRHWAAKVQPQTLLQEEPPEEVRRMGRALPHQWQMEVPLPKHLSEPRPFSGQNPRQDLHRHAEHEQGSVLGLLLEQPQQSWLHLRKSRQRGMQPTERQMQQAGLVAAQPQLQDSKAHVSLDLPVHPLQSCRPTQQNWQARSPVCHRECKATSPGSDPRRQRRRQYLPP